MVKANDANEEATKTCGGLKLLMIKQTYDEAVQYCAAQGGSIAMPSNANQTQFLQDEMCNDEVIYIGLDELGPKGDWRWRDQRPWTLGDSGLRWHKGEPNDYGQDEECVAFSNGRMYDIPCNAQIRFACSFPDLDGGVCPTARGAAVLPSVIVLALGVMFSLTHVLW
eukprot:CAMPEP_0197845916 /NCGR_PEP_ID=MMETSP1438-20131217/2775_1 /TAXON_ID=1461541 /ORGANISM="Pterosperma sp., Strain CCMP1384" /LENGTH=166 /DNA_ID=CAMNT_0043457389 /DNA_START=9 /DNA_END=509 /DNA_ORIENTATION=-